MRFLPENIASFGGSMDSLIVLITVLTGIGLVVAEGVLLYALARFRRSRNPRATPLLGEAWSQSRWVLMPVAMLLGADLYIDYRTHGTWEEIKGELPEAEQVVRITGQQFNWMVTYPGPDGKLDTDDDFRKPGDLHVPVDQNIVFELEARDVLHSFWVPALRLKQDAIPGRTIRGWFRATKEGEYEVACAEICGAGHTMMKSALRVVSAEAYAAWVANGGADAPAAAAPALSPEEEAGKKLVEARGCSACHTTSGEAGIGPTYRGLYGRSETVVAAGRERQVTVDDAYLRRSILDPAVEVVKGFQAVMPPQAGVLDEADLGRIIAYLKTLH